MAPHEMFLVAPSWLPALHDSLAICKPGWRPCAGSIAVHLTGALPGPAPSTRAVPAAACPSALPPEVGCWHMHRTHTRQSRATVWLPPSTWHPSRALLPPLPKLSNTCCLQPRFNPQPPCLKHVMHSRDGQGGATAGTASAAAVAPCTNPRLRALAQPRARACRSACSWGGHVSPASAQVPRCRNRRCTRPGTLPQPCHPLRLPSTLSRCTLWLAPLESPWL